VYLKLSKYLYIFIVYVLSLWPDIYFRFNSKVRQSKEKRIAYYIWHFPILTETFIQREIIALRKSGLQIEIIADDSEEVELFNAAAKTLKEDTHYIGSINQEKLNNYKRYFFSNNPFHYISIYLLIVAIKYNKFKSYEKDKEVFSKCIYLCGVLREKGINHIHSPWANFSAFTALLASKLLKISYTVQARAYDLHRIETFHPLKPILENSEFIITNSEYNRNYIKSILDKKHGPKIHKIYNGLDLDEFSNSKTKVIKNKVNLLTVSRITEQKGILYLLEACKILKDKNYNFKCEIIGSIVDEDYYAKLQKVVVDYDLNDCVFFLGPRSIDEVKNYYMKTDILVLPCVIVEGSGNRDITPNTLLEAMAMKVPVVSTNITAIPEIVEDGKDGILVDPGDEEKLAEAIIMLIQDSKLRNKLAENARNKVAQKFNVNKNISQYIALFKG